MNLQVLLCGVGGQGILFATRILSETAIRGGDAVIGSETHGMSQRGGSVTSHMKIGSHHGPLIKRGDADLLFCFEKTEIFANLTFLKRGGIAYIDAADLNFIPEKIQALLKEREIQIKYLDASAIALKMNAPVVLNQILIGFAAGSDGFPLSGDALKEVISDISPGRFKDLNIQAFEAGHRNNSVVEG